MKNVIYFLALILISFCACSTKDKYASILQQFVELNEAMGVEKETVGVIVAQVKNTINNSHASYRTFWTTVNTQCTSALSKLNGAINQLSQSIAEGTSQLNSWKKNLGESESQIRDANINIKKAKGQIAGLKKQVNRVTMDYRVYAAEADKRLVTVKALRDIITDELLNRSPGALIQLNKFQAKLNELKEMLNTNSDSLYSPMISVLLDLATEQNFSDQSVLRKILQNLNNLRNSLISFRQKQEAAFQADLKNLRSQIRNVIARLRAYRKMRNQSNSKRIDAAHYITYFNHELQHFNAEKARLGDQLNLFVKLCSFEKKVYRQNKAHYQRNKGVVTDLFARIQSLH